LRVAELPVPVREKEAEVEVARDETCFRGGLRSRESVCCLIVGAVPLSVDRDNTGLYHKMKNRRINPILH